MVGSRRPKVKSPDSKGRRWIAQYNVGQVGVYDPSTNRWAEWRLPGDRAQAYAVYVDEQDKVWLTDTRNDTVVRFDPATEAFTTVAISKPPNVAQLGRSAGEIVGAQRARDHVFVIQHD